MIDLLLLMLINALAIIGIYLSFGEGMIFRGLGLWIEKKIHYDLTKPLFNCPTCMASIHSILPYWCSYDFNAHNVVIYVFYVAGLSALSTFIANNSIKE